jgi:hypothetical protein
MGRVESSITSYKRHLHFVAFDAAHQANRAIAGYRFQCT